MGGVERNRKRAIYREGGGVRGELTSKRNDAKSDVTSFVQQMRHAKFY